MSESKPTPKPENHSGHEHGFKAFLKAFSFGDANLEGDDDNNVVDDESDGGGKLHVDKDGQHHHHHSSIPFPFGNRNEAGLHGGTGVRWYHNLFPLNQKFEPRVEYPLWDDDWDSNQAYRRQLMEEWAAGKPPSLVTRHILLVRHGQYDEHHKEERDMKLTPLGQQQAKKTGERIAKIIQHNNSQSRHQGSPIKVFAVSDLTRAKQTADIIYKELELMYGRRNAEHPSNPWEGPIRCEPDPLLNEGFPVHHIPGPTGFRNLHCNDVQRDFPRAEEAFLKYIGTSRWLEGRSHPQNNESLKGAPPPELLPTNDRKKALDHQHHYEIIVGHENISRYFICRALQIPPEAWLRLNLYHCSISYLVVSSNGHVAARTIGDMGHIPYEETSVDGNIRGFNWE